MPHSTHSLHQVTYQSKLAREGTL